MSDSVSKFSSRLHRRRYWLNVVMVGIDLFLSLVCIKTPFLHEAAPVFLLSALCFVLGGWLQNHIDQKCTPTRNCGKHKENDFERTTPI